MNDPNEEATKMELPELTVSRARLRPRAAARALAATLAVLAAAAAPSGAADPELAARRAAMVDLIRERGVTDATVLEAMAAVPRHEFVPRANRSRAYGDHPLPIGHGQTISQPYIVAFMTARVEAEPGMKVLEVGTGSGYQAAVLAEIGCEVFTIEIFEALAESARERLQRLGYRAVTVRHGDGHEGWPGEAPFDAIVVTAAAGYIPPALVEQLRPGGRMVIPVGSVYGVQNLILADKDEDGELTTRNLLPVRFVPMLEGTR